LKQGTITGVVKGSAGGAGGPDGWNLVIFLQPWRRDDDVEFERVSARVLVPTSEAALGRQMGRLDAGMVVKFATNRIDAPTKDHPWWLVHGVAPVRTVRGNAAMREARAQLDAPVVIRDPLLGRMTLKRDLDWFIGTRRLNGRRYELSVSQSGKDDDRARDRSDLTRAGVVVQRFEGAMMEIRRAIARRMLSLYNDNWREEGPALTAERFLRMVKLSSAVVNGDGSASLYFSSGDLFSDHGIEVRIARSGRVTDVGLA